MRQSYPTRAGNVGWYVITISDPGKSAQISLEVDKLFANSRAETKTETEAAFQQSFVSMSGALLTAMNFISFIIIGVILLVLANTMVMTARERTREYAVLKTLGFSKGHILGLISGESLAIAALGGLLGILLMYPSVKSIEASIPSGMFPIFAIKPATTILSFSTAIAVGIVAAIFPSWRASSMKIVDGLRQLG